MNIKRLIALPLLLISGLVSGAAVVNYQVTNVIAAVTQVVGGTVAITGTGGQFSCTCTGLVIGQTLAISGTYGGTGSLTGYSNPTTYLISATNGTSTFSLQTTARVAIVTTAGTPTGLAYTPVPLQTPTVISGFSSTGSLAVVTQNNDVFVFSINVGTSTMASSGVVAMPTARNYWACDAHNPYRDVLPH